MVGGGIQTERQLEAQETFPLTQQLQGTLFKALIPVFDLDFVHYILDFTLVGNVRSHSSVKVIEKEERIV